jgi:hypothetical protein
MKNTIYIFITIIAVIFLGCEKDSEFTNNPPQIEILTATVAGSIGETISIKAKLSDDYVLKYAKVSCVPLLIDDVIYISIKNTPVNASSDIIKSSEDFSYDLTIPSLAESGKTYQIKLEVKNVTGQISDANIVLNVQ